MRCDPPRLHSTRHGPAYHSPVEPIALEQLAREVSLDAPHSFARDVASYVDRIAPITIALPSGATIDAIDVHRTTIVQRAAETMRYVQLFRLAAEQLGSTFSVQVPVPLPAARQAAHLLGRYEHLRIRLVPRLPTIERELRLGSFALREELRALSRGRPEPTASTPSDIVVIAQQGSHIVEVEALLAALREEHGLSSTVLSNNAKVARRARRLRGVTAASPVSGRAATARDLRSSRAAAARAVQHVHALDGEGGSGEVTRRALAAITGASIHRLLPQLLPVVRALDARIDCGGVAGVLAVNPYTFLGRGSALLARQRSVPVAAIEHGTMFPDDPRWQRCPVDLLCVWGEAGADALRSVGFPDAAIAVTGSPKLDRAPARAATRAGNQRHVLVATSGAGDRVAIDQHLSFVDLLTDAIERTPLAPWLVKLHPKDDIAFYDRRGLTGLANVQIVGAHTAAPPIEMFLSRAACVVTVASATALDGAAAGIPVIVVPVPGSEDHRTVEFLVRCATAVAPDAASLAAHATAALDGTLPKGAEGFHEYLSRHFAHRGAAASTTSAAIAKLAQA